MAHIPCSYHGALLIDKSIAKIIADQIHFAVDKDMNICTVLEATGIEYNSLLEFSGIATPIIPSGCNQPLSFNGSEDVFVLCPKRKPDLFAAAYASPEALIEEYKQIFEKHGIIMPEDFDWFAHLENIHGKEYKYS